MSSHQAQLTHNNVTDQHAEYFPFSPPIYPPRLSPILCAMRLIGFLSMLLALWLLVVFGQWRALARVGGQFEVRAAFPTGLQCPSVECRGVSQGACSYSYGRSLWVSITTHFLSIRVSTSLLGMLQQRTTARWIKPQEFTLTVLDVEVPNRSVRRISSFYRDSEGDSAPCLFLASGLGPQSLSFLRS